MSEHPPHQPSGWGAPDAGRFGNNQYGDQSGGSHGSWPPDQQDHSTGGSGRSTGLILGIIGGVAVLALVIGGIWVAVTSGGDDAEAEAAEDATGESEVHQEDDEAAEDDEPTQDHSPAAPGDVVEGYLTALAEGDIDAAVSYMEDDPRDDFLTNELISESLELAPISDIEVDAPAESEELMRQVPFSYTLGEEQFSGELQLMHQYDSNEYQIMGHDGITTLRPFDSGTLSISVNGEELSASDQYLLMGLAYQVDVAHENFMLESTDDEGLVVAGERSLAFHNNDIVLTEEAEDQWRTMIQDEAAECLEATMREAGCGLDLPETVSGAEVVEDTVDRHISTSVQQTLDSLSVRQDYSNPNLATTDDTVGPVDVQYDCVDGAGSGRCELVYGEGEYLDRPVVDMAAEEPEVVWE